MTNRPSEAANILENNASDDKLVTEVITKLNVCCRRVEMYPKDHPAVETSLKQAHAALERIFQALGEVTLSTGKHAVITKNGYFDKQNPVFHQMTQYLRRWNIAYITFSPGISSDELYYFHHLLTGKDGDFSAEEIKKAFTPESLPHIKTDFVEYDTFSFEEGKSEADIPQQDILDRYILGLTVGSVGIDDFPEAIAAITTDILEELLARMAAAGIDTRTAGQVVAAYIRKSAGRAFSRREMERLLFYIDGLPPAFRKQCLEAAVEKFSQDITCAADSLQKMSPDLLMMLMDKVREQKIELPETLKQLMEKLLHLEPGGFSVCTVMGNSVDDIFLPLDIAEMVSEGFKGESLSDACETSLSDAYRKEMEEVLKFDASDMVPVSLSELRKECADEYIEQNFTLVILELMSSDIVSEQEYRGFLENLREQTAEFLCTGQYSQVLRIVQLLILHRESNKFADIASEALAYYYSQEFYTAFIDSLKVIGRQAREEAWQLCEFYGERVIPLLLDALIDEDSQAFRSLLMSLLKRFGDKIVAETLRRLDDPRWFVKRNMLYLLAGCKNTEIITQLKPYCRYENHKVRFEAIKCLLGMKEHYALEIIKEYLLSGTQEEIDQSVVLVGAFRIREAVPDLIRMLRSRKTKADLSHRLRIVQALGNIGDARVLDAFREILSSKRLLFTKGSEKLKEAVYGTLRNFPYEEVEDIVLQGRKSKNEVIKNEALRLQRIGTR